MSGASLMPRALRRSVYAHFLPTDDDLAREIMNGFFSPALSGENALEMTSGSYGKSLWLVNAFPDHYER